MDDTNGIVERIKRVLESHEVDDQSLINALILEGIASNSKQLQKIRDETRGHNQVHLKISEEQTRRQQEITKVHDSVGERLEHIENVVYFPSRHPKRFTAMVFGLLFLLNLWFISGFRELLLQMMNAPDWLIDLLVPGAVP
jgi:hypothetical protein